MKKAINGTVSVSRRLEKAIGQLTAIQNVLTSNEGLDQRILTDFRDALNRVRNVAWSAQQFASLKATEQDPASFLSILAGERIRVAFQLVQLIQSDLTNEDIKFQPAQLIQLQNALAYLSDRLDETVGKGSKP
jgi:hypothetical protein